MIYRPLGRTGFETSVFGLGGESALYKHSQEAVDIITKAVDLGVNYFDTAPLYQDSELNYGDVLPHRRSQMFIATKTDQRDYGAAWDQFEQSLRRLNVQYVDLLQIHHLDRPDEIERIFAPDGAVRMVQEAKDQGLARFIGVTGHSDPKVLLEAINRHPFDTILMALNPAEIFIHSFQAELLPRAEELGMGIMAMKVFARGILLDRTGWGAEAPMRYVLSLPVSNAVIGVMNETQLERNVELVDQFEPLSPDQMEALEDEAGAYSTDVNFYRKGVNGDFPVPPNMMEEAL